LLSVISSFLAVLFASCDKPKKSPTSALTTPHFRKPTGDRSPRLAIILDDVGGSDSSINEIFSLPSQLTLSILPHHAGSSEIAEEAHRRGYEVMLHLPMESLANESAESEELRPGMSSQELSRVLDAMLGTVPHAVGVNNHQGSRATSDPKLMKELMPLLLRHHLFFIDSRTTAATIAYEVAQQNGVRSGFRNVPFLDDVPQPTAIRQQLERAIHGAKEKGEAIVIGHPHPETLEVLRQVLPELPAQGIELVHASALVHASGSP
jgi:polysaccharide deacetylase 2 family uncharacterized protein YibQ